jgi:serine/threonine protein kinase
MFNNKVDIWSIGCILFELAVGKRAFDSDFAVLEHKLQGRHNLTIILDESFSNQCKARIEKTVALLLRVNPASWPSASTISKLLSHYFNSSGTDEIERLSDAEVLSAGVIPIDIVY